MLQKKLDYGFNGYQLPFIPKAARSARRRYSVTKKVEDNQMCAFDMLATVAGNLLLERETSQNTIVENDQAVNVEDVVMEEQHDEVNPLKVEHCHQASTEIPSLKLELGLQAQALQCDAEGVAVPQHGDALNPASLIMSSDCLKDDANHKIALNDDDNDKFCHHLAKPEQCSTVPKESCLLNLHECVEQLDNQGELLRVIGNVIKGSEDVNFLDTKPPQAIGSDCSFKPILSTNHNACGSLSPSRGNNVEVVTRDDDENFSGCTQPSIMKLTRRPAHIGGRKIRKLLASKYRRVAPKVNDGDLSDTELRYIYCSRKTGYKRQRSQRIYPFKKRKSFYYSSLPNNDGNISYKGIYSPKKAIDSSASFVAVEHGVNGSSSSVTGQSTSFPSRESHVKIRIKSFRVPELFIEMPETASIGSLKRTVMEALSTLLRGGLHVGVFFQGKKIRDDNRTLLQSGIGRNDLVESLGVTLEPNAVHASLPISSEDNSLVLSSDVPEPLSRCPDAITIHQGTSHHSSDHPLNIVSHLIESDHDSAPSPAEISAEKGRVDSRALAFPEETPQALAMIPAHQKSKRAEMAQRRIRRPFSVVEVEALVQAVEKFGTGRWRDVKLRAFDNVKHRTYVDLKDKWKTLVHTARISPQQRRGEPVPQELLDRVLAAHSYWSQQQTKQQLKQPPNACPLL